MIVAVPRSFGNLCVVRCTALFDDFSSFLDYYFNTAGPFGNYIIGQTEKDNDDVYSNEVSTNCKQKTGEGGVDVVD